VRRHLLSLVVVLASACATPSSDRASIAREAPWAWGTIGATGEFAVRQRIHYDAGGTSGSMDAALEATCDVLMVVVLNPFGSALLTIRQEDGEIEVAGSGASALPFPPERLLLDVHRVFLYPLDAPKPGGGTTRYEIGGTQVEETWREGRLWERRVSSTTRGSPIAEIRYPTGWEPGSFPDEALLRSQRLEYTLRIESSGWRALPCRVSAPAR
jgi:hypothetical protein